MNNNMTQSVTKSRMTKAAKITRFTYLALLVLALAAPAIGLYPIFVMKLLCFALFACAFNLLLGFTGLLSFGHAAFFGSAWPNDSRPVKPSSKLKAQANSAKHSSFMTNTG